MILSKRDSHIPKPNEIWLLLDSRVFGGIETHVLELAIGLQIFKHPVRVVFITQYDEPSALVDRLQANNIRFSYLYQVCSSSKRINPVRALRQGIKRYKPILVHAHGYKASVVSRFAKVTLPKGTIKQFTTYHAGETPTGKVGLYDWLDRHTSYLSEQCFAVSKLIQDKVPADSIVLNNFVSTQDVRPSKGQQIAFVGRLSMEKGPDRFVDLACNFPYLEFHVYGTGPMETELLDRGEPNVLYHGHQNNMTRVWENVGLLVISSRYEGLPMSALEAMARGIPVAAMKVGALDELIDHRTNGWLAESDNELLAGVMEWLQLTPEQKKSIANNAQYTINLNFSSQAVVPKILNIYQIDNKATKTPAARFSK
ncbi:glycosyltransferase family 4 protein [Vibrio sp. SCSIO 43136]|uniref:glycosyltransferase family 4 protein n=1 Tax=Vibrio sp. SCSIO 43136 TaxID=2819101 RepID=UPI00207521F3|nr:glycosyltransferase family 4 protein [Vibrio sp. SCSIO 43136]USD67797.1 glycosyltransferase family 4 protein [Vibrio sp. SCSIO 43136]